MRVADDFTIEKDVPIPATTAGRPATGSKWDALEVGDSVLLVGVTQPSASARTGRTAKNLGRKFTTRKVDGGVRVWRVA